MCSPAPLDYTQDGVLYTCARNILEQRLSDYRFLHSISVSQTAVVLAELYGVDEGEARIAGLVHDWDKNYSDEELIARAREFGVPVRDWEEDMAALLHAQTGAEALRREFPMFSEAIIQAVARHTSAASDMSPLDMVIYVADMIEPLRTQGNVGALRALVGKLPLEALFLKSYETTMKHLVTRHRFIHPDSLEVWNTYIHKERIGMKHTKKEHM